MNIARQRGGSNACQWVPVGLPGMLLETNAAMQQKTTILERLSHQEGHIMTLLTPHPARDSEVLAFWNLNAQWHRAAAEALTAYLG